MVSAFAITGIKLTRVPNLFIISTSSGLTLNISLGRRPSGNVSSRSSRLDEVQASVNPQVLLVQPVWLLFLPHVGFVLVIDKVDDGCPARRQLGSLTSTLSATDLSRLLT